MDIDEILPIDPFFHPLLVKPASAKGKKKRKVGEDESSRGTADQEEDDDDAPPSQTYHPFSNN